MVKVIVLPGSAGDTACDHRGAKVIVIVEFLQFLKAIVLEFGVIVVVEVVNSYYGSAVHIIKQAL